MKIIPGLQEPWPVACKSKSESSKSKSESSKSKSESSKLKSESTSQSKSESQSISFSAFKDFQMLRMYVSWVRPVQETFVDSGDGRFRKLLKEDLMKCSRYWASVASRAF